MTAMCSRSTGDWSEAARMRETETWLWAAVRLLIGACPPRASPLYRTHITTAIAPTTATITSSLLSSSNLAALQLRPIAFLPARRALCACSVRATVAVVEQHSRASTYRCWSRGHETAIISFASYLDDPHLHSHRRSIKHSYSASARMHNPSAPKSSLTSSAIRSLQAL